MRGEIIGFFIIKQIKTSSRVFPYTSFVLYRFLRALQQNRAQSRLLYLLNITRANSANQILQEIPIYFVDCFVRDMLYGRVNYNTFLLSKSGGPTRTPLTRKFPSQTVLTMIVWKPGSTLV